MKITGCMACWLVAVDCAEKAVGEQSQHLFSAPALWVWWIIALYWAVSGVRLVTD